MRLAAPLRRLRSGSALLLAGLLGACGGGGPELPLPFAAEPALAAPASCAQDDQRAWLRSYLRDAYFWNDGLAAANAQADSMDAYFRSMLFQPLDRYSYTQPVEAYNQFFTDGTRTGYGYTLVWTDAARTVLRVRSVEPLSPVGRAGLRRGDQILSIDGLSPQVIAAGGLPNATTEGVARTFTVLGADGRRREWTVASATFALSPVTPVQVLTGQGPEGSTRVAYMAFHEFIIASETALDQAFARFNAAGATELVLDLRYNGGGSVVLARGLGSMVAGPRAEDQAFADIRFNARNAADNFIVPFTTNIGILPGPVFTGLRRVVIITSAATASASELLINALRPFMPVVLVGETTYGKPYGFQSRSECGTTYSAVNFETFNARGEGRYVQGIAPACEVADDLDHELGDPAEARLAAALHYLRFGSCPGRSSADALALKRPPATPVGAIGEAAPAGMWLR